MTTIRKTYSRPSVTIYHYQASDRLCASLEDFTITETFGGFTLGLLSSSASGGSTSGAM